MEWILFICALLGYGLWLKRQNTLHMRRLAKEVSERKY